MSARKLITEYLDLWTGAVTKKSSSGRGSNGKVELTGVKKLRELILELAVRGQLLETQSVVSEEPSENYDVTRHNVGNEDYPFLKPRNWSFAKFIDVLDFQGGGQPPKSMFSQEKRDGYVQLLQIRDLGPNPQPVYVPEESVSKFCTEEDILIGRYGASVGKVFWGKPGAYNVALIKLINRHGLYMPAFLYHLMTSPYGQSLFVGISRSAQSGFSKKDVANRVLPLPPLAEQYHIVQKVDELMALCDRLEQQTSDQLEAHETLVDTLLGTLTQSENATELADNWARLSAHFDTLFTTEQSIDKLKQTILQLAVMGRLVEQDAGDESAQELLRSLAAEERRLLSTGKLRRKNSGKTGTNQSALQELPSGWALAPLSQLGRFSGGKTPSKSKPQFWGGHIPWVTPKDMKTQHIKGSEDRVTQLAVDEGLELYPENAVLFVVRSGILRRMFPAAITAVPCTVNQDLKVLSPYLPELSPYIQLMMLGFEQFILKNLTKTGTTVESLKFEEFANCQFPIPPLHEQARILERVDEVMILCDQLKERLNQASETRNQLAEAVVEGALN